MIGIVGEMRFNMSTIEAIQMLKENPSWKFKRYYEPSEYYDNRNDLYCILSVRIIKTGDVPEINIVRWDGQSVGLYLWDSGWKIIL